MGFIRCCLLVVAIVAATACLAQDGGGTVTFENASARVTFSGTFYPGTAQPPYPVILILSGHGPHGTSPQSALGRLLNDSGYATLSYDEKRADVLTFDRAGRVDMVSDTEAAIAYLKGRPDVDPKRIGLFGSSAGAVVASAVAAQDPSVAFLILTGMPAEGAAKARGRLIAELARKKGCEQEEIDALAADFRAVIADDGGPADMRRLAARMVSDKLITRETADNLLEQYDTPGARALLTYDSAADLRNLGVPILALYGSLDMQAPPDANIPALLTAVEGKPAVSVIVLPGLDHSLRDAGTDDTPAGNRSRGEPFTGTGVFQAITHWLAAKGP